MAAVLASRGPGIGVHSTSPLEVCCPSCGVVSKHELDGHREGAVLHVYVVAPKSGEYSQATLDRIYRREGLTHRETGVAMPQAPGRVTLPADKVPFAPEVRA